MKRSFSILIFLLFMLFIRSAFSESQWPIEYKFSLQATFYMLSEDEMYFLNREEDDTTTIVKTNADNKKLLNINFDFRSMIGYNYLISVYDIFNIKDTSIFLLEARDDLLNERTLLLSLENNKFKKIIFPNDGNLMCYSQDDEGISLITKKNNHFVYSRINSKGMVEDFKLKLSNLVNSVYLLSTQSYDKDNIYFIAEENQINKLFSYNHKGNLNWSIYLPGYARKLSYYKDRLYILCNDMADEIYDPRDSMFDSNTYLLCYSKNGQLIWRYKFNGHIDFVNNIFVNDKNIYIFKNILRLINKESHQFINQIALTLDGKEVYKKQLNLPNNSHFVKAIGDYAYYINYNDSSGIKLYKQPLYNHNK